MHLQIKFQERYTHILFLVVFWLLIIFAFAFIGTKIFPNQHNYLGGGEKHYLTAPLFWGWSNFDGEHYVAIAREGYKPLEYFFFPAYPLTLRYFANFMNNSQMTIVSLGIVSSTVFFIVSLFGLAKLWRLDHPKSSSLNLLLLFLLFPTSFYFISVYTESMFLMLAVWCLYFARRRQFLIASVLAFIATATRVIGFSLVVALLIEWILQNKPILLNRVLIYAKSVVPIFIAPLGLVLYMYFLKSSTGDPLVFIHQVSVFGDQRSSSIILLPQVFFRYIVKIFPHLTLYWPVVFTTVLEFLSGSLFLIILLAGIRRLRLSYIMYFFIGYIVPSFAGSFSSMPRYVLVLFPAFFLLAEGIQKLNTITRFLIYTGMTITLFIATALFIRGYWVS